MPVYTFRAPDGTEADFVLPIDALDTFKAEHPEMERVIKPPRVVTDLEPYESPVTGEWITSRSQQREDLAKSGCRIVEPDESPTGGKLKNPDFCARRGFEVSEEYRDLPPKQTKEKA